jgi:hypothetical protein|nr:MAG TPA: hypothetical protein [Caudoviricetes sp.]
MQQVDVTSDVPTFYGESPEEIIDHFGKYNFVDDHGHELTLCGDFIDLVNLVIKQQC